MRAIAPRTRTLSRRDIRAFYAEVGDVVAVPRFRDRARVLPSDLMRALAVVAAWLLLCGRAAGPDPRALEVARPARRDRPRGRPAQRRRIDDPPRRRAGPGQDDRRAHQRRRQ